MENNLRTLPELQGKVKDFYKQLSRLRENLKPVERRLKTLDEHLRQAEIIRKNSPVYRKYLEQKDRSKDAFYKTHRSEIMLFEAADRYMKEHLNGRTLIPIQEWQAERSKLILEKTSLSTEYQKLKAEIRNMESIRKFAEKLEVENKVQRLTSEKAQDR